MTMQKLKIKKAFLFKTNFSANFLRIAFAGQIFGFWIVILIFTFWILDFSYAQQKAETARREEMLQDAQKHYLTGKRLIQQGNYAAANDEFKKAQGLLEDASGHSQSHGPEGDGGQPNSRSQTQASTQDALKPIVPQTNQPEGSGLPSDRQSHQPEGRGLAKDGDVDEALSFYLKAIELAPKDIDRHYNLALLHLKTKQYKEAAACLEKVIQLNPEDKDAYYNLGVLYESYLGDKKKALDYYAQYIKYGSANGDAQEVKQWMRQLKKELKK